MNEKIIAFAICLLHKNDASRFSGPEHFFCLRALYFLKELEGRFCDADSTDADASIDRVARCLAPLHLHVSRQILCDPVRALEKRALSANSCTAQCIPVSSSRSSTLPTLASFPAPAILLFLPLSFYLHIFPSPPVFLHRDKFKAR